MAIFTVYCAFTPYEPSDTPAGIIEHSWAKQCKKGDNTIKTLFLVRHAKSSWKEPHLSDHERPLNKRGMRDAPFMAQLAAGHVPESDRAKTLLMSSDALRAITTAREFAKALGMNETDILQNEDLYLADELDTLDEIKTVPDEYDTLFIFGHNPGFTYLLNRLCNLNVDNVPTCGVACLRFDMDSWMDISFGKGELVFFEYPKKYYKEPLSE